MKTLAYILIAASVVGCCDAQMNGYVPIQVNGQVVMAARAGTPMYSVPSPVNTYQGCYYNQRAYSPGYYNQGYYNQGYYNQGYYAPRYYNQGYSQGACNYSGFQNNGIYYRGFGGFGQGFGTGCR